MKKYNRQKDAGFVIGWISSVLFLIYFFGTLIIWGSNNWAWDWIIACGLITVGACLFLVALIGACVEEEVETIGFQIFQLKVWDKKLMKYVDKYAYAREYLCISYIFHWEYKRHISYPTSDGIMKNLMHPPFYTVYNSHDDTMKQIIKWAKNNIANIKAHENKKISTISYIEHWTIESILNLIQNENSEIQNK